MLLVQGHVLLDLALGDEATNAGAAAFVHFLADPQLLLGEAQHLVMDLGRLRGHGDGLHRGQRRGSDLLRRGFDRAAPPPGSATSGTYRLVDGDLEVELSSLGIRATVGPDSVFLDRDPMARVLRGADLRGADLFGADLSGADLREADLREADLRGANLSGAYRPTDVPAGWNADANGRLERDAR
jgi:hypothetical protein